MPAARKVQQKRPSSGDTNYANPNAQQGVNAANEVSINEGDSDESEEDEYDNDKDDSPNPFSQPPRMPPYDFAKRKLSQLIGTAPSPSNGSSCDYEANVYRFDEWALS